MFITILGHELNFAVIFFIFQKLNLLSIDDYPSVVLVGFSAYIKLMRRLQTVYMLEPAGSHGVWGLDDYHCLLFVWGAAQLSHKAETHKCSGQIDGSDSNSNSNDNNNNNNNSSSSSEEDNQLIEENESIIKSINPSSILDKETVKEYASEFLYLEGIQFILSIKFSAPFQETSPMLSDIRYCKQ